MRITARDIARALVSLSRETREEDQGALVDAAFRLLDAHRFSHAVRTFPRLVREILREEGEVTATVHTPRGVLPPEGRTLLLRSLAEVCGRTIPLEEHGDPSLLGGVTLTLGDDRFDASLRSALERLAVHLNAPIPVGA